MAQLRRCTTPLRTRLEEQDGFVVEVVRQLVSALEKDPLRRMRVLAGRSRTDEHEMARDVAVQRRRGLGGEAPHRPAAENHLLSFNARARSYASLAIDVIRWGGRLVDAPRPE